jgi:hypothetical protein
MRFHRDRGNRLKVIFPFAPSRSTGPNSSAPLNKPRTNGFARLARDETEVSPADRRMTYFWIERVISLMDVGLLLAEPERRSARFELGLESLHPFMEFERRVEVRYRQNQMIDPVDHGRCSGAKCHRHRVPRAWESVPRLPGGRGDSRPQIIAPYLPCFRKNGPVPATWIISVGTPSFSVAAIWA